MATSGSNPKRNLVFDFITMRWLMGLIVLLLPGIVRFIATEKIPSISWSYHTEARDYFVGLLFVIGAFLISYKGHKREEDIVSSVGGIAAWVTALNPTAFSVGSTNMTSTIHYLGAFVLFSTTVYFCLYAFTSRARRKSKRKDKRKGKGKGIFLIDFIFQYKGPLDPAARRILFYQICGLGITSMMVLSAIVGFSGVDEPSNLIFLAQTIALLLFGTAWLVASQFLPFLIDKKKSG